MFFAMMYCIYIVHFFNYIALYFCILLFIMFCSVLVYHFLSCFAAFWFIIFFMFCSILVYYFFCVLLHFGFSFHCLHQLFFFTTKETQSPIVFFSMIVKLFLCKDLSTISAFSAKIPEEIKILSSFINSPI